MNAGLKPQRERRDIVGLITRGHCSALSLHSRDWTEQAKKQFQAVAADVHQRTATARFGKNTPVAIVAWIDAGANRDSATSIEEDSRSIGRVDLAAAARERDGKIRSVADAVAVVITVAINVQRSC